MSILVTFFESLDFGQNLDFGRTVSIISLFWSIIFANSQFWSTFSKNREFGRNFRKISILVEIFEISILVPKF